MLSICDQICLLATALWSLSIIHTRPQQKIIGGKCRSIINNGKSSSCYVHRCFGFVGDCLFSKHAPVTLSLTASAFGPFFGQILRYWCMLIQLDCVKQTSHVEAHLLSGYKQCLFIFPV